MMGSSTSGSSGLRATAIFAAVLICSNLTASLFAGEVAIAWTLATPTLAVPAGGTSIITVDGVIPATYHGYSPKTPAEYGDANIPIFATQFALSPTALLSLSDKPTYPRPTMMKEENSGVDVETFEKSVSYTLPVRISKETKPGDYTATLTIRSQICGGPDPKRSQCFESRKTLEVAIKVTAASAFTLELPGLGSKKPKQKKAIDWQVKGENLSAARGQTLRVEFIGKIPEGYHTYSTKTPKEYGDELLPIAATEFDVEPAEMVKLNGQVVAKNAKPYVEKSTHITIEILEGTAEFSVPIQVSKDAKPGSHEILLSATSQMCTETNCELPDRQTRMFKLLVTDAPPVTEEAPPPAAITKPAANSGVSGKGLGGNEDIAEARSAGLLSYLWLSMSMGALSLLTPCVFPMIPITVSFFTKRKQISRAHSIRDAGFYALGIILTFVLLGFLVTLLLGASGGKDLAAHPISNFIIFIIFTALAMSLFGAFEIQLPTWILNKLNSKSNEGDGIGSVLLMGLVFTLTSFTCTGPFIGATLLSATQGDFFWPLVGMIGFATTFSLPFVFLAMTPSWLKALPKSGGWLNSVKVVMGFLELAAALKFASNIDLAYRWGILTRGVFLSAWVALALLSTYYLLGRFQMTHDTPVERISSTRLLFATLFLSLAIWLGSGLFGNQLGEIEAFLPEDPYPGTSSVSTNRSAANTEAQLSWFKDVDAGLAEAKKTKKRVFLDFTGYLCTNCRLMEKTIFPRADVHAQLNKYVVVKLYTDGQGDEAASSQKNSRLVENRFGTTALPFYVILTANDEFVDSFPGLTRDANEFAEFLKNGLTRAPQSKK